MSSPKFFPGQIIRHLKLGYRGVVFAVDGEFSLSDDWYDQVARSRPPKDAPWYHVMVDGGSQTTYVAERHLEPCEDTSEIEHPLLEEYFEAFDGGAYRLAGMH